MTAFIGMIPINENQINPMSECPGNIHRSAPVGLDEVVIFFCVELKILPSVP
jgi:hypothetical protein